MIKTIETAEELEDGHKIAYQGQWQAIHVLPNHDNYEFLHETRCKGQGVAVLGFRPNEHGDHQYLLRYETIPPHRDGLQACSLTGGIDENERPEAAAVRELEEESGFKVDVKDLIELGFCRPYKGADSYTHCYAVDLTNKDHAPMEGDGTEGENRSYSQFGNEQSLTEAKDPTLAFLVSRLKTRHGAFQETSATKFDYKKAYETAVDAVQYYLTRAKSLPDFLTAVAGYVGNDGPELSKALKEVVVKHRAETASAFDWNKFDPRLWYRAVVKEDLPSFKKGTKVWVKANTEKPLRLGLTLWVFGTVSHKVSHITKENFYSSLSFDGRDYKDIVGDKEQQKKINLFWKPVVANIISNWNKTQQKYEKII